MSDEALQAAFTDFERHADRKAWEKAFTALSELPADKRTGMLEDGNGYLIAAKERIWNALVSLPPAAASAAAPAVRTAPVMGLGR